MQVIKDIELENIEAYRKWMGQQRAENPDFDKQNAFMIFQRPMKEGFQSRTFDVYTFIANTERASGIDLSGVLQDQVRPEGIPFGASGVFTAYNLEYKGLTGRLVFEFNEYGQLSAFNSRSSSYERVNDRRQETVKEKRLVYSSIKPYGYPNFTGNEAFVSQTRTVIGLVLEYIKKEQKYDSYRNCTNKQDFDNLYYFIYYNYPALGRLDVKEVCYTTSYVQNIRDRNQVDGYLYLGQGEKKWKPNEEPQQDKTRTLPDLAPPSGKYVFVSHDYIKALMIEYWQSKGGTFNDSNIKVVRHPQDIPAKDGGGYKCDGSPWDNVEQDSTLADDIKDLLDQHKKTFYLLGKKTGEDQPKLYLFNLGQVGGTLTYSHILKAIVYKQVNCNWVKDEPLEQDLEFSSLEGEIDTNFYLLTNDKLDKPSKITKITHRMANEYLLKHFPTCSVIRPEGGGNPNDDLKPDFGGGNGGIGGSGQGGLFPEVNNPLPNPEVPPCTGTDGGSQAPVSEIYLLSVPELSPTYDDTYDFPSLQQQFDFFTSKNSFMVSRYSYLRKDNAIQIGSHVDNLHCYNYLMYKNKFGKWYYCFIMHKEYINERTARLIIATDVIQTYLFDYTLGACFVERCHVPRWKDDGVTPTDEFEHENLEFGEPLQVEATDLNYKFKDTYIAVCSNPLGVIPSRSILRDEKPKGVDVDGL